MKVQETIFAQSFVSRVYGMPVLSFLTPDFLLGAAIHFQKPYVICSNTVWKSLLPALASEVTS